MRRIGGGMVLSCISYLHVPSLKSGSWDQPYSLTTCSLKNEECENAYFNIFFSRFLFLPNLSISSYSCTLLNCFELHYRFDTGRGKMSKGPEFKGRNIIPLSHNFSWERRLCETGHGVNSSNVLFFFQRKSTSRVDRPTDKQAGKNRP